MLSNWPNELDEWFGAWRHRELGRVDAAGLTYLDYGGAALYPSSLIQSDMARLDHAVLGNPHSEHAASRDATDGLTAARDAILSFLGADPAEYAVVLTANASAACRLVGEGYPFSKSNGLVLTADNHNSVNGLREFARPRGAETTLIGLDDELRLLNPLANLRSQNGSGGSLLAFPAQSNFSGVRHSLALVPYAQSLGYRVLLDAAALLPTMPLDLSTVHPDFLVLSIYKIAGYPGGIGALVARHDALAALHRPWFAGGTVDWVSVAEERHQLRRGVDGFEDGTPPFLAAGAVADGLALVRELQPALQQQLSVLTAELLEELTALKHSNGISLVTIHGPSTVIGRGATVAFTLRDPHGKVLPFWTVEVDARDRGIAVRGGCFCNPGCAERAFAFPPDVADRVFEPLRGDFSAAKAMANLPGLPVGALRISFGLGSLRRDVTRAISFLRGYLE